LRAVIFANGELKDPPLARATLQVGDLIIAADGGGRHCLALGIDPAVVIGDFDSLTTEELEHFKTQGAEIIPHPRRKNETDLELALLYAAERGAKETLVLGALGGRLDMTLSNFLLTAHDKLRQQKISFLAGKQRLYPIYHQVQVEGQHGDVVSLIPIGGDVEGITTQGLEYPLKNETLHFGATRGISNVLLGHTAEVTIQSGMLLCIVLAQPVDGKIEDFS
jgi:thiamine pyrophosphokinase